MSVTEKAEGGGSAEMLELKLIRQRSVQAIGAGLSRRDWRATETAYNELRDRIDDLLIRLERGEASRPCPCRGTDDLCVCQSGERS